MRKASRNRVTTPRVAYFLHNDASDNIIAKLTISLKRRKLIYLESSRCARRTSLLPWLVVHLHQTCFCILITDEVGFLETSSGHRRHWSLTVGQCRSGKSEAKANLSELPRRRGLCRAQQYWRTAPCSRNSRRYQLRASSQHPILTRFWHVEAGALELFRARHDPAHE